MKLLLKDKPQMCSHPEYIKHSYRSVKDRQSKEKWGKGLKALYKTNANQPVKRERCPDSLVIRGAPGCLGQSSVQLRS